jgi:DNA repair/transcription protein MET18/MMS19
MTYAELLYDVFGDESIGWDAAKALGDIVSSDTVLTRANHADVKVI